MNAYSRAVRERILLALLLGFAAVFFLTGFSATAAPQREQVIIMNITVQEGDSLWKIAQQHMKRGQDIRNVIYEIRAVNQMGSDVALRPGQQLKVPCRVAANEK